MTLVNRLSENEAQQLHEALQVSFPSVDIILRPSLDPCSSYHLDVILQGDLVWYKMIGFVIGYITALKWPTTIGVAR